MTRISMRLFKSLHILLSNLSYQNSFLVGSYSYFNCESNVCYHGKVTYLHLKRSYSTMSSSILNLNLAAKTFHIKSLFDSRIHASALRAAYASSSAGRIFISFVCIKNCKVRSLGLPAYFLF